MHPNEKLIEMFYTAFKNSDPKTMAECYHPDVEFSDPVFPYLKGKRAMAMWALLGQRKADPNDRWFENIRADDKTGSAHWEAKYKFPANGRPVHNKIDAKFEFLFTQLAIGGTTAHVERYVHVSPLHRPAPSADAAGITAAPDDPDAGE